MSFVVDANVLLYAVNSDSEYHHKARKFIEKCAETDEHWCLPWPIICAFIRIATHPSILPYPLATAQAVEIIDGLLELPHIVPAGEDDPDFWRIFRNDLSSLHTRGNDVSDALVVAIMRSKGVSTIYSKDRDFLKFSGIKVLDPIR